MKYEVKVYINGELNTLVKATPEQIKELNKCIYKALYEGGNENE